MEENDFLDSGCGIEKPGAKASGFFMGWIYIGRFAVIKVNSQI